MGMNRDMMARLQQVQQQVLKAQQELSEQKVEGSAGGGAVSITVSGGMKVQALKIASEVVDPDDVEMLEDLVTAAVNEALGKIQALQMQQQVMKAQQELSEQEVEGSAGGGAVSITVSGGMKVQALKIEPEVVDPDDVEMLEDLVTAAVNEALGKIQALQMQQLGGLAGQFGIGLPQ